MQSRSIGQWVVKCGLPTEDYLLSTYLKLSSVQYGRVRCGTGSAGDSSLMFIALWRLVQGLPLDVISTGQGLVLAALLRIKGYRVTCKWHGWAPKGRHIFLSFSCLDDSLMCGAYGTSALAGFCTLTLAQIKPWFKAPAFQLDHLLLLLVCRRGEKFDRTRHEIATEVKAITYSAMQIREQEGDAEVFVIVDI